MSIHSKYNTNAGISMINLKRIVLTIFFIVYLGYGQEQENPLKVFGYFQNSFNQETHDDQKNYNSFNMQQLNIMFQKELLQDWTAFINFQAVNSFSAERQWGSFSIEEAWIRYRYDNHFNLKLGLQIPVFNRLNEIKNRTPLLPYIVVPLVYQDSFSEDIDIESYVPKRAFFQVYGYWSFYDDFKLDYAAYLGNSPNISRWQDIGNSGQDTTDTILSGGRIGIRYEGLKAGFSYTSDQVANFSADIEGIDTTNFPEMYEAQRSFIGKLVHRTRIGFDLSFEQGDWLFDAEYIDVLYDDKSLLDLDKHFYYGTLGYEISDDFFSYLSYWFVKEEYEPVGSFNFRVLTPGLSYNLSERITLKAQYARVLFETNGAIHTNANFSYYSSAISVYF